MRILQLMSRERETPSGTFAQPLLSLTIGAHSVAFVSLSALADCE